MIVRLNESSKMLRQLISDLPVGAALNGICPRWSTFVNFHIRTPERTRVIRIIVENSTRLISCPYYQYLYTINQTLTSPLGVKFQDITSPLGVIFFLQITSPLGMEIIYPDTISTLGVAIYLTSPFSSIFSYSQSDTYLIPPLGVKYLET